MLKTSRIWRQRRWLAAMALAVAMLGMSATRAMADDPVPDKTGAFQTTPTAYSVPGYTKPDAGQGDDEGSGGRGRRGRAGRLTQASSRSTSSGH